MSGFSVFSRNAVTKGNNRPNGYWGLARDSATGKPLAPNDQPLFTNFQPTPTQWDPASNTAVEPLPYDKHEDPKLKTQKYAFGTNPIEQEDKLKNFVPPPNLAAKLKDRAYQNMIDEAYRKYQHNPERLGPELLAIITARRQHLDRNITREVSTEVVDNFRQWLMKKGDVRDHVRAGWWPAKKVGPTTWIPDPNPPKFIKLGGALSDDPSVTAYLDSFVLKRVEYEQDLLTMKLEASHGKMQTWNIDQLWKYYKYVVLGLIPDVEYDNLLNTINPGPPSYVGPAGPAHPPPPGAGPAPDDPGDLEGGDDSFAKYAGQGMPPEMVEAFAALEANAEQYLLTQNQLMEWMAKDAEARQKEAQRQRQDKADRHAAKMHAKDLRHEASQRHADRRHAEHLKALQSGGDAEQADAGKKAQHEALAAAADKRLQEVIQQHEKEKAAWAADLQNWHGDAASAVEHARKTAEAARKEAADANESRLREAQHHGAKMREANEEVFNARAEAAAHKERADRAETRASDALVQLHEVGNAAESGKSELEEEKRLKADMVEGMFRIRNQLHAEAEAARQEAIKARTEALQMIEAERAQFRRDAEEQERHQMVLYQAKFADMQKRQEEHHRQAQAAIAQHAEAHERERLQLLAEVEAARVVAQEQRLRIEGAASEQLAAAGQENEAAKGEANHLRQLVAHHAAAGASLQQQNAALQEELRQLQMQHANVAQSGTIAQIAWRTEKEQLEGTIAQMTAYVSTLTTQLNEHRAALEGRPAAADAAAVVPSSESAAPLMADLPHPPAASAALVPAPEAPSTSAMPPKKRVAEDVTPSVKRHPGFSAPQPGAVPRPTPPVLTTFEGDELEDPENLRKAAALAATVDAWIADPTNGDKIDKAIKEVRARAAELGVDPYKVIGVHLVTHFAAETGLEDELAQEGEVGRDARNQVFEMIRDWCGRYGVHQDSIMSRAEIQEWAKNEYGEFVNTPSPSRPTDTRYEMVAKNKPAKPADPETGKPAKPARTEVDPNTSGVLKLQRAMQSLGFTPEEIFMIGRNQALLRLAQNARDGSASALSKLRRTLDIQKRMLADQRKKPTGVNLEK